MLHPRFAVGTAIVLAALAAITPSAYSALGGSGNVTDFIDLTTEDGSLNTLVATAASASGGIITSSDAFHVTNGGSNVDTLIMYSWASSPTVGGAATSIALRSTTYHISDLLWFRQETIDSGAASTLSAYYSPLVVESASNVQSATFTSDGNACTGWANNPGGLTLTASGSFTVKYYTTSATNDAPSTTSAVHYCLDTANNRVYLNSAADFTGATLVEKYTTNSANGVLETYRYGIASNQYCLYAIDGSGSSATPELHQCSALPFEQPASTAAKLYALFDPPAYFPSVNKAGTVAFSLSGVQWNPYSSSTISEA